MKASPSRGRRQPGAAPGRGRLPRPDARIRLPRRLIEIERDSWILIAAQIPEEVPAFMAIKHAEIEHETLRRLYLDVGDLVDCAPDDPRLPALTDRVAAFLGARSRRGRRSRAATADQRGPDRPPRRRVHPVLPMRDPPPRTPRRARLDRLDEHQTKRTRSARADR